ncbi:TetR/AcrR family transcriptional regulator [Mycolicibacterium flavescens]|uniref:TetR family transcriptional regulator n=1 Tax=Mycolicibacterium flavescens TaxID=1776 RepID=A0A1E3RRW5_MYCFV|nr:TetR/AcrR family transcriptional regulator [Mycolicibacterium flavescens]MCV7279987.1 TetR/AcrR family transcriptional regulator [Mycolicibacterium flavescens]ODQ92590.1 TetR family transcriptional regulator [Mycolicibacterium flavescens]
MTEARGSRLTVEDWINAGYAILAEEGIKGLKLEPLCARVDATKGSFYWHFSGMEGYRQALVQAWGEVRDADRSHFAGLRSLPPRERLSQMMAALVDARHWRLERAMREWARTDDAVAAGVRASDARVVDAVRQAFVDDGFDSEDADVRANATFAAGIGFLHLSGSRPSAAAAARRERFLDIMLTH